MGVLDNYVDLDCVYVEWLEISRRVYYFFFNIILYVAFISLDSDGYITDTVLVCISWLIILSISFV